MATTQTPAVGDGRGSISPAAGHQPITEFIFETPPTQDEVRARLAALEAAKHATHTVADPFCPLCPAVRRAPRCPRCEDAPVEDENVPCDDCLTEIGDDHWACPRCPAHWYRTTQSHEEWAARLPVVQVAHLARHDREAAVRRTPVGETLSGRVMWP